MRCTPSGCSPDLARLSGPRVLSCRSDSPARDGRSLLPAARRSRLRPSTPWRYGNPRCSSRPSRQGRPSAARCSRCRRGPISPPPQLLQALLVEAEIVRDLVYHRDPDLLLQGLCGEIPLQRTAEDRDLIRQEPVVSCASLRQRHTLIQPVECLSRARGHQRRGVVWPVVDHDRHVVQKPRELWWQAFERPLHQLVEIQVLLFHETYCTSRGLVARVRLSPRVRRFRIHIVLVFKLGVALVAANHGRSLHRARLSCHLPDLTFYESPLLASLGELLIEPLKALLLCVQLAR